ncbi:MAG: RNA polymerase sigma factor, partial [Gemmatimonadales bacterium]
MLALRAASGDSSAFEALYREHLPQIYGLCIRMTGDEATAADLTQEIFIRTWKQLANFRGGNFGGWIYTLGRNVILNDRRARARFASLVTFEDDVAAVEPLGPRISLETALTISAAIEKLPPRGQVIFRLHDVDGYSADEIAEFL